MTLHLHHSRILLLLVVLYAREIAASNGTSATPDPDELLVDKIRTSFDGLRKVTNKVIKAAMPFILHQVTESNLTLSPGCQTALFKFLIGIKNFKPWALYMVDAWGKTLDGLLLGTLSSFGNYDECVDVVAKESLRKGQMGKEMFQGQYCTIELLPDLPKKPRFYSINKRMKAMKAFENDTELLGELTSYVQIFYLMPFRLGICVPSLCSAEDIHHISANLIHQFVDINVPLPRCEIKNVPKIENYQLPTLCVFAILLVVLICGTTVDTLMLNREKQGLKEKAMATSTAVRCLRCFSVYTNCKKLLDVNAGSDKLKVLHGVRFYSISWIVLGHTYYHITYNILRNMKLTLSFVVEIAFNIISNATLVVDNFFFISGLLMSFVSYELAIRNGRPFPAWQFVIHRFYRFWPMQMSFVGITTLLPLFGDGPLWKETIDPLVGACRKDWWSNMIFINNFYRSGPVGCVSHSWYLAADMQIYLICLFALIPLVKYPRIGLSITGALLVASMFVAGCYNYIRDLPPTMLFSKPDKQQTLELMREIYYTPYHHLAPYCIGIIVGHFLHTPWAKKKMPVAIHVIGWLLTVVITSATLLGVHTWNSESEEPDRLVSAFYAAFSRVSWTLGLAWITWVCSTGQGGIVGKLLTWKALIPLSRLTFSVYLVHPYVQRVFYANIRGVIEARNYMAVFMWFGFLVVSYLLSFIVCVCIESPFINMGAIIFEKHKDWGKRDAKAVKDEQNNKDPVQLGPTKTPTIYRINDLKRKTDTDFPDGYRNDGFICHL